jgi:hypothetical protein
MYLLGVCVALMVIGMTTAVAQATSITVVNPGFDADVLDPLGDGYSLTAPTGWIKTGRGGYQLDGAGDGLPVISPQNWAFLAPHFTVPGNAGLGQLLQVPPVEGESVTIYAHQGHRLDHEPDSTQAFRIQVWRDEILNAGTLAGESANFGNATPGAWTLRNYNYTFTADDVGHNMYFNLLCPEVVGGATPQIQLDNVGVYTGQIVPEPSALALVVTGLIGLLACAWRRRK